MNVDELRSALRQRAGTVSDHDAAARVGHVHTRVRAARRRRVAGVAALTVGALAIAGAVVGLPNRGDGADLDRPAITPDPAPLPTIEHEGFVSHSGAYDLVAAVVGEPGQNSLELDIPAHREDLLIAMRCSGIGGPSGVYWVSGWAGDKRPGRPDSNWCGNSQDGPEIPGVSGTAPGPWNYVNGQTIRPRTTPSTVHVELTQELDEDGRPLDNPDRIGTYTPVDHPDVVLGIGVYKIADPVVTVAGAEIPPLVGLAGQDYAYQEHRETRPGGQSLALSLPPSDTVRYYDFLAADAVDPDRPADAVHAVLDDESCINSVAMATFRAGGCLLAPGVPHTIRVTIEGEPRENAVLGLVIYEQAG